MLASTLRTPYQAIELPLPSITTTTAIAIIPIVVVIAIPNTIYSIVITVIIVIIGIAMVRLLLVKEERISYYWFAIGKGSGLIEYDSVDFVGNLEGFSSLDENAVGGS